MNESPQRTTNHTNQLFAKTIPISGWDPACLRIWGIVSHVEIRKGLLGQEQQIVRHKGSGHWLREIAHREFLKDFTGVGGFEEVHHLIKGFFHGTWQQIGVKINKVCKPCRNHWMHENCINAHLGKKQVVSYYSTPLEFEPQTVSIIIPFCSSSSNLRNTKTSAETHETPKPAQPFTDLSADSVTFA